MNSLPLHDSYEVLRTDKNDFVENENDDTTAKNVISERNSQKRHKGTIGDSSIK